jgi:hypothetical protein
LISFIGEEIVAVSWRQFRIYQKQFVSSAGNPSVEGIGGYRAKGNDYPAIFNIERDQHEEVNTLAVNGWMITQYLKLIGEYQKSLEKYHNPKRSICRSLASDYPGKLPNRGFRAYGRQSGKLQAPPDIAAFSISHGRCQL